MITSLSRIFVPWCAWQEETQLEFNLTKPLSAELLAPTDAMALNHGQIRASLANPIQSTSIRELARNCKTACIAVDDLARPTRAADVLPDVFRELKLAGISPENCTIVVATGTHSSMTSQQIEQKIGPAATYSGVHIEVHDPVNLSATGILYGHDELLINKSFLEAEFKLGISSVLPHSFAGYSGGAKMMLPGLANIEATARSHKFVQMGLRGGTSLDQNRFRQEIEELALRLNFRFTICVVTNRARETVGVFAGDLVAAHRQACELAARLYRTPCTGTFDALILNAYPKDLDFIQAENALTALKQTGFGIVRETGVIVICSAARAMGQHGLFGPGGKNYSRPRPQLALGKRELWILAPYLSPTVVHQKYWEGYPHFSSVAELDHALGSRLGSSARVGVVPCAPMQQLVLEDCTAK